VLKQLTIEADFHCFSID